MGFLGSKPQKSESGNKAYPWIKDTYSPMAEQGVGGYGQLGGLLGLNGQAGNAQALDSYWNSAGGKFQLDQGLDALTSKYAAMGLSKSGAAMKGMEQFRQGLASTYLNNYLGQLSNYSQLGLGAGGLIANAGQYSKGTGQTQGLAPLIGAGLSLISDRRAKTNIERVGDWDDRGDGLGKYSFTYNWAPDEPQIGVMADEVRALRPKAFIPNFARGYDGVNYAMLELA